MFKLFHNKDSHTKIIDRIFMRQQFKWSYCQKLVTENPKTAFAGWFDETITDFENSVIRDNNSSGPVLNARTINKHHFTGSVLVFIEHHPMKSKEETLFQKLELPEVIILSALDEPLLLYFGGEKLISTMRNLGMKEDEVIEHQMISQAIAQAQEKIEKKMIIEQTARSQAEWMKKNFK